MRRVILLWAFCSAKGGVGKSTLAVATAKLLAAQGRTCMLVDADLTGTSLADGLRLCAPRVWKRADGEMDLDREPDGYLTREETLAARRKRMSARTDDLREPPPFLNDVLVHRRDPRDPGEPFRECLLRSVLWRHEPDDRVLYLPSSPAERDVDTALGWLYFESRHTWIGRMTWMFEAARIQIEGLTDIVLDLPPGLFGFADEALELLSHIDSNEPMPTGYPPNMTGGTGLWGVRPFLVTTPDRNDLGVALSYYQRRRLDFPNLTPVLNRGDEAPAAIARAVEEQFGVVLDASVLRHVPTMVELAAVFRGAGDLDIGRVPRLADVLGLHEVPE